MKLAIMQPYFFPYLGYFQLINAVDKFVFYDDVNYIKGGWINRNNIIQNNEKKLLTLNLIASSTNKDINEIYVGNRNSKMLKTIKQAYSKAPFFEVVFPIVDEILSSCSSPVLISEIAGQSIIKVAEYLNIKTVFEYSSEMYSDTKGMDKAMRLIEICKRNNADDYINAVGGANIYSNFFFTKNNINLFFIKNQLNEYKQFNNEFVPSLSIIDVMMFNLPEQITKMLNNYNLV